MNADEFVSERFNEILARGLVSHPHLMEKPDRVLWYITATKCESAINGFESVFEQFLDEEGVIELELCLREIEEHELAMAFASIREVLTGQNFWNSRCSISELAPEIRQVISIHKGTIETNDRMYELDSKIQALYKTH